MYYYKYLGLKIESDFQLTQLMTDTSDDPSDVKILRDEAVSERVSEALIGLPRSYIIDSKHAFFRNKTLDMEIIDGNTIYYLPSQHERSKYTLNCLTGWGSSILLLQRGILGMHASVVEKDGKAYLISGVSGAGKSTVTAKLLEEGCRLVADDMTAVHLSADGKCVIAEPAFPYQKLCRDAAMATDYSVEEMIYIDEDKDKFFVPMFDQFVYHAIPVAGMVHLVTDSSMAPGSVTSSPIEGLDKLSTVTFNIFLRPLLLQDVFRPEIGSVALGLAGHMRMTRITRATEGDSLDAELAKIHDFMKAI